MALRLCFRGPSTPRPLLPPPSPSGASRTRQGLTLNEPHLDHLQLECPHLLPPSSRPGYVSQSIGRFFYSRSLGANCQKPCCCCCTPQLSSSVSPFYPWRASRANSNISLSASLHPFPSLPWKEAQMSSFVTHSHLDCMHPSQRGFDGTTRESFVLNLPALKILRSHATGDRPICRTTCGRSPASPETQESASRSNTAKLLT